MIAATKMRHDLDRIMLEGNTVFQQLRLRADALDGENKRLLRALREARTQLAISTSVLAGQDMTRPEVIVQENRITLKQIAEELEDK